MGAITIALVIAIVTAAYGQSNGEVKEDGNCPALVSEPVTKGGGFFNPYWHNMSSGTQKTYTPMANPTLSDDGKYMWFNATLTLKCWNWVKYKPDGSIEYVNWDKERVGEPGGYVVARSNCTRQNDEYKGSVGTKGLRHADVIGGDGTCSTDIGGGGAGTPPVGYVTLVCETVDYYTYYPASDTAVYQYSQSMCYYVM